MKSSKFTVSQAAPNDAIENYGEPIIKYIAAKMKRELAEAVLDILAIHNEIIIAERELPPVENVYPSTTEFRREIEWAPFVRCKDCEWWTKGKDSLQGRCELMKMYPTGEWYCGNGRRKDNG